MRLVVMRFDIIEAANRLINADSRKGRSFVALFSAAG